MPIPAIAAGAAATLPHLAKVPGLLKALYGSKYFLHTLIGAGYLGGKGLEAAGQAGERGLTKEQMKLQNLISKASVGATERGVTESRARTKEYIKTLMKAKKEERKEARDLQALQSFSQSQDRQMGLVIQAMQALSGQQKGASTQSPGGGMLGLMKGEF